MTFLPSLTKIRQKHIADWKRFLFLRAGGLHYNCCFNLKISWNCKRFKFFFSRIEMKNWLDLCNRLRFPHETFQGSRLTTYYYHFAVCTFIPIFFSIKFHILIHVHVPNVLNSNLKCHFIMFRRLSLKIHHISRYTFFSSSFHSYSSVGEHVICLYFIIRR